MADVKRYNFGGSRADAMQKIKSATEWEAPDGDWVEFTDDDSLREAAREALACLRRGSITDAERVAGAIAILEAKT